MTNFIDIYKFNEYFKKIGDGTIAKIGHINYLVEQINQNSGGGGASIIQVTKTELDTLISDSTLIPGTLYKITGVDVTLYGGTTIFLKALTTNKLETSGTGQFFNPKYDQSVVGFNVYNEFIRGALQNISGTFDVNNREAVTADNGATGFIYTQGMIKPVSGNWSAATSITGYNSSATADILTTFVGQSYNVGDKVHWGGKTWVNLNGNLGQRYDLLELNYEWSALPFDNVNYNEVYDEIKYDYENDLIIYRNEQNSNIVSFNISNLFLFRYYYTINFKFMNPIKVFMWGNVSAFNDSNGQFIGIGNQKITHSYNENINFRGSAQNKLTFDNGSVQNKLTFDNYSYQRGLTFDNQSSQNSLTFDNESSQDGLTFDKSYQTHLDFNNSSQRNIVFVNSGQQNLKFINESSQENLTFINGSNLDYELISYSNKQMRYKSFNVKYVTIPDLTLATHIWDENVKEVYQRLDGLLKIKFMNDLDILQVVDITA